MIKIISQLKEKDKENLYEWYRTNEEIQNKIIEYLNSCNHFLRTVKPSYYIPNEKKSFIDKDIYSSNSKVIRPKKLGETIHFDNEFSQLELWYHIGTNDIWFKIFDIISEGNVKMESESFWSKPKEIEVFKRKSVYEIKVGFSNEFTNLTTVNFTNNYTPRISYHDFLKRVYEKSLGFEFNQKDFEFLTGFNEFLENILTEEYLQKVNTSEKKRIKTLEKYDSKDSLKQKITDGNNDFLSLVRKHQKQIIETDKSYLQNFIKISNYLKTKGENIESILSNIKQLDRNLETENLVGLLENNIHSYNLIQLHSLNMVISLVEDDFMTFYEIYESFDKLKIFNSTWELEVSEKLKDIEDGIIDLIYSIDKMEMNILRGINNLNYMTQESFKSLQKSVSNELKSIDSSIKFNNLLTGISTYQLYKINKNTKS